MIQTRKSERQKSLNFQLAYKPSKGSNTLHYERTSFLAAAEVTFLLSVLPMVAKETDRDGSSDPALSHPNLENVWKFPA